MKTSWAYPDETFIWAEFSYIAPQIVQLTNDTTIPEVDIRNRGRRPNLSTFKAARIVTIRSRIVLPPLN